MAQRIKLGDYLVEIDGTRLAFFDVLGNPIGTAQDFAEVSQVTLPNGQALALEQLTELLDVDTLAAFQTAAGEGPADTTEIDSGGGRFAAFESSQGIGSLEGVGGLSATELTYLVPEDEADRDSDGADDLPLSLAGILEDSPPESEQPEVPEQPQVPVLLAPKVSATDGRVDFTMSKMVGEQNPLGDQKVGDYLRSGGVNGKAVNPAMVNGVDSKNLTMAEAAEVKVSFVSEGAGYKSMVGFYTFDANGNINPDSLQFLWLDASQAKQNTPGG
ncbi:MAG: hypothetical protein JNL25_13265, partial [Rhodospirillaceae bacterium]|nr:hypothetical protein [Rhodospirillaceae bacterium]